MDLGGLSYARLRREGGLQWPCPSEGSAGICGILNAVVSSRRDGRCRKRPDSNFSYFRHSPRASKPSSETATDCSNVNAKDVAWTQDFPNAAPEITAVAALAMVGADHGLDASSDLTRTLTIFGTPGYIAPEQAKGPASSLKATLLKRSGACRACRCQSADSTLC